MLGNGSARDNAFRIGPDGGSTSFSSRSTNDRWMSLRNLRAPGVCSATAPAIHTSARPSAATSSAPPIPSIMPASGNASRRLIPSPIASNRTAASPPIISAVTRLKSGAYGELEPPSSRSGPRRLPAKAPIANPASDSALTISPCE